MPSRTSVFLYRYLPIVPTVLINGAEGIGTGWSTSVPNYNPRDVVANIRRLLADEPMEPMHPWYRSFNGTIEEVAPARARATEVSVTAAPMERLRRLRTHARVPQR